MESLLLYLSSFLYSVLWARHYQRRDRIRPRSQSTFSQVSWAFIIMLFPIILSCYRYGIGVDYIIVKFNCTDFPIQMCKKSEIFEGIKKRLKSV